MTSRPQVATLTALTKGSSPTSAPVLRSPPSRLRSIQRRATALTTQLDTRVTASEGAVPGPHHREATCEPGGEASQNPAGAQQPCGIFVVLSAQAGLRLRRDKTFLLTEPFPNNSKENPQEVHQESETSEPGGEARTARCLVAFTHTRTPNTRSDLPKPQRRVQ